MFKGQFHTLFQDWQYTWGYRSCPYAVNISHLVHLTKCWQRRRREYTFLSFVKLKGFISITDVDCLKVKTNRPHVNEQFWHKHLELLVCYSTFSPHMIYLVFKTSAHLSYYLSWSHRPSSEHEACQIYTKHVRYMPISLFIFLYTCSDALISVWGWRDAWGDSWSDWSDTASQHWYSFISKWTDQTKSKKEQ